MTRHAETIKLYDDLLNRSDEVDVGYWDREMACMRKGINKDITECFELIVALRKDETNCNLLLSKALMKHAKLKGEK